MKKVIKTKEFSKEELILIEKNRDYEKRKKDFIKYIQDGMEKYKVRLVVNSKSTLENPEIIIV